MSCHCKTQVFFAYPMKTNHCARLFCSFTDNTGLCGIPGLPTCGSHLSAGAKIGIGLASLVTLLLLATCLTCWWKRRQNILRAQKMAGKLSSSCGLCLSEEHMKLVRFINSWLAISVGGAARSAPYAKARTQFNRDVQMARHHQGHEHAKTAAENGPSLLA